MLHRKLPQGRICITQPAHAWVSGQLATAWGNDTFGSFSPWPEVCLGAEQHDIGWLPWEAAPTFNPQTGYPHSFTEVSTQDHIRLWQGARQLAMPLGRYTALLVSLHGTGLYERYRGWEKSAETTQIVQHFLQQEKIVQHQLIEQLQREPRYQEAALPDAIARNRRLVATWDTLSLLVCMGVETTATVEQVPLASGETDLTLRAVDGDRSCVNVSPWPFRTPTVEVICEGRQLHQPSPNAAAMQIALEQAPWATLKVMLIPG